MIWETIMTWIVERLEAFGAELAELVPDPPGWALNAAASVSEVAAFASTFGHWVPWSLVVAVLLVVVGCIVAAFLIRIVRIVASFMTLGGGA